MKYVFQRSKIWVAGNPADPASEPVRIKVPYGSKEARARRKLPEPGMGRIWILIAIEESTPSATARGLVRAAAGEIVSAAVTSEALTEDLVRHALVKLRSNRPIAYLCRAYLQFGPEAMSAADLDKLCDHLNRTVSGNVRGK